MASTVLPNGIIIPEKYSRDWYNDLYHNWQELDNLLGGGTPKDGTLTIQKNGTTVGTFSANQATNETIDITVPTKTSDLTNDSNFVESSDLATVATSGSYNDLSDTPTIPTVNNATLTIQRNGTAVDTFTANASVDKTININTADDTKIPLAGSNAISGSLVPATDNSIDVGSSTKNIKMLYTKGITIDGTQFLPDGYIPRNGGFVITSNVLGRTVDNDSLALAGGNTWNSGAIIIVTGKDYSYPDARSIVRIKCVLNDTTEKNMWIRCDGTWIWEGTACQITSDQRYKQQITEIDDKLLDAWEDVDLVQFKYNDAVDTKGKDKARLHTGYVVQQIDKACKEHGVDISQYGLYCHEEYLEETEEVEVEQEDGTKTKERKVIREASEHYSLRYTEVYAVECMYLRKRIKELEERLEKLEGNNSK